MPFWQLFTKHKPVSRSVHFQLLMSHEPVDTVNKPCEAKQSLYLPLGHHSKHPHSCCLSRNNSIVPITAKVPSFSQAQAISFGGQLGTTMFELHTDVHGWRHSSPHQSVLQHNQYIKLPFLYCKSFFATNMTY